MSHINLPNRLTLLRILLVPIFILSCSLQGWLSWWNYLAVGIFLFASLTDVADGRIARSKNLVTNFGKLMDPVADKLLVCSAFIMLTWLNCLSPILCILFVGREFVISGFRLVTASSGSVIAASNLGKAKTVLQVIAIILLLLEGEPKAFSLGQITAYVAAILSVWSAADYIWKNRKAVSWE